MKTLKLLTVSFISLLCVFAMATPALANSPHLPGRYVAIGDSVAAGAGLPLSDDSPEARACGKSTQSYPHQVASLLETQVTHLACGGATVPAGITGPQQAGGMSFAPQIDKAFEHGRPDLITLTVGTNDVRWSDFIRKCYASNCGTWQDTLAAAQLERQLYSNLKSAMQQITQKSSPERPPQVILTGYFQPLSNDQPVCFDTAGITASEISWVRAQAAIINGILAGIAVQFDFVKYAHTDFKGHELCSPQPWVQGLRDRAAYHPTAEGQNVIADAVLRKIQR